MHKKYRNGINVFQVTCREKNTDCVRLQSKKAQKIKPATIIQLTSLSKLPISFFLFYVDQLISLPNKLTPSKLSRSHVVKPTQGNYAPLSE